MTLSDIIFKETLKFIQIQQKFKQKVIDYNCFIEYNDRDVELIEMFTKKANDWIKLKERKNKIDKIRKRYERNKGRFNRTC